jgi:hypothetical protein
MADEVNDQLTTKVNCKKKIFLVKIYGKSPIVILNDPSDIYEIH